MSTYGGTLKRYVFVLPLPLSAIYNNYLQGSGRLSKHVQSIAATDLTELPFTPAKGSQKFRDVTDQIAEETKGISAIKYFFETFGLEPSDRKIPLKLQFGRACFAITKMLASSPLGTIFGKKTSHVTL